MKTFAAAPRAAASVRRAPTSRSLEAFMLLRPASDSSSAATVRQTCTTSIGTSVAARAAARMAALSLGDLGRRLARQLHGRGEAVVGAAILVGQLEQVDAACRHRPRRRAPRSTRTVRTSGGPRSGWRPCSPGRRPSSRPRPMRCPRPGWARPRPAGPGSHRACSRRRAGSRLDCRTGPWRPGQACDRPARWGAGGAAGWIRCCGAGQSRRRMTPMSLPWTRTSS